MSNVFTLDSFREEVTRKFAPVKIQLSDGSLVELRSILRLKEDARKEVVGALNDFGDLDTNSEDESVLELVVEAISKIFNLIADKPAKLLSELDSDDLLFKVSLMSDVLVKWGAETQLGEAKNSPTS